jgi:uncharacterized protein
MATPAAPHPALPAPGFVRRHPVATYFVAAAAFSWSYWIPLAVSGARVDFGGSATHVPGLFGPAAAALLVTFALDGWKGILRLFAACVTLRGGWRWLAFAALSPLVLFAAATLFTRAPPIGDLGVFGGFPEAGVVPVWAMLLIAAYGEEVGWRGFALRRLQQDHSALSATVILTCAWAAWHVPAFFVVAGYAGMNVGTVIGFFFGLLGGAFVLTWMYNRTGGSVLMVALWHASFNLVTGTRAGRGVTAAVVSTVVMLFGFALAIADLRARRKGEPPVLA